MIRTVYIAGPMRGMPQHGFPAFDRAAAQLRGHGFEVVSPADLSREAGYENCDADTTFTREQLSEMMWNDLSALADCDAVLLLENWEHSVGVAMEISAAKFLGIPVFQYLPQLLAARAEQAA